MGVCNIFNLEINLQRPRIFGCILLQPAAGARWRERLWRGPLVAEFLLQAGASKLYWPPIISAACDPDAL